MRMIISNESGNKSRDKVPIYLISGFNNLFENIKNKKMNYLITKLMYIHI